MEEKVAIEPTNQHGKKVKVERVRRKGGEEYIVERRLLFCLLAGGRCILHLIYIYDRLEMNTCHYSDTWASKMHMHADLNAR
jgi:hypothetical protein